MSDNTELIRKAREWAAGFDRSKGAERQNSAYYIKALADELEAAKPRQVTTVEELDALPFESVVKTTDGNVWESFYGGWYETACRTGRQAAELVLPATVLYSPVVTP